MREPVVISIDKDLLQIPGWNYNPGVRGKGGRLTEITAKEADRYHLYQTLVGDDTDGYVGCPGVGTKKATKLLDDCAHLSAATQWEWVVEAYRKRGLDEEAALVQARVARILRAEDWDPIKKEHRLWTPPRATTTATPALTEAQA
jgi:DNA polymerase-1